MRHVSLTHDEGHGIHLQENKVGLGASNSLDEHVFEAAVRLRDL